MSLDYNTLLVATGLSGLCLAVTLFASWLSARVERFLLAWAIGMMLVVASVFCYALYVEAPSQLLGFVIAVLMLSGFSVIYAAAYCYRTGNSGRRHLVGALALSLVVCLPPILLGYDGLGLLLENLTVAILLGATAWEYWKGRREALLPLTGIVILYSVTAVTFVLCALVLLTERQWVLDGAPENWAEDLNLIASIIGITGIGAMSLALNQWRIAGNHRQQAMTDPLTGLLNRRALFDRYGNEPLGPHVAVIAFDLDRFKTINDQYGHAAGDGVLVAFAAVLRDKCRSQDSIARLGGEEFAIVLHRTLPDRAAAAAERIRTAFSEEAIAAEGGPIRCTVSAGIAFGSEEGLSFDSVLNSADKALYASKRGGRNRVSFPGFRRAG